MTVPTDEERLVSLRRSLTNHTPSPEGIESIGTIREAGLRFGGAIIKGSPAGRERSLALTAMEEAVMWAVKAVALETGAPIPDFEGAAT